MSNLALSTSSSASSVSPSGPPAIPMDTQLPQGMSNSSLSTSSSASLASPSSSPVIPMDSQLPQGMSNSSLSTSSSASLASPSSPPVIPMDTQLPQSMSNSSLSTSSSASTASPSSSPVIPIDGQLPQGMSNSSRSTSSSASLASPCSPLIIPMDTQLPQSISNSSLSTSFSSLSASSSAILAFPSNPPFIPIDQQQRREFFKVCVKGDFSHCINLMDANPDILLFTNRHMNNCLHIAAMLGHHDFANQVLSSDTSRVHYLLNGTNADGETPLMAALMAPNRWMASAIITAALHYMQQDDLEEGRSLSHMLLKINRRKENVLHLAIKNGFENLAFQLLDIEQRLSVQISNAGESPMFMAVRRGYTNIVDRLLQIPFSTDCGPQDISALYVAVLSGYTGIAKQLLERRPQLAYRKDKRGYTPFKRAIVDNNLDLVKIFLEFNDNFTYMRHAKLGTTPFIIAAQMGHLSIAKEILNTCPDSVYITSISGGNALHYAILNEKLDIINYIVRTPQLHRLINQADYKGQLPLHLAAIKCNPKILRSLLTHAEQDCTAFNFFGDNAVTRARAQRPLWKTLKWNESITLLSNVIPSSWKYAEDVNVKQTIKNQAIQEVKLLTTMYKQNTSLVAALLATITFAAAFTLPGGFSSDPANAGLPIFSRKVAYQVFLISDTIAMCSSLSVAFLCILGTWEDLDFLLNYRKTTRALMWCAYVATALAFGTGLFTVIAQKNLWLAILILVLCTILPLLSKIIGEWPLFLVRYRLGGLFKRDLAPNI